MPSKTLSSNVSRSFPSPIWTSWLNLMQSVHRLPGIAFFFFCSLFSNKTLNMSCSGSSSVTYGKKNWSPVQIPKNVAPIFHFFFLTFSFSFFQEIIVSLYRSHIVHSLQYKVLKCQTKININVTVARISSKIDPCHSWLKCSVRLNFIWIFFPEICKVSWSCYCSSFLGVRKTGQLSSQTKIAGREWEESGSGMGLKCWDSQEILRKGLLSLPSSRAVVFIGPNCGIRTLPIWRVTVRFFKLHRILQSQDKIKPSFISSITQ